MCQGNCTAQSCQGACSPTEARLRQVLQDIETLAREQLAQPTCTKGSKRPSLAAKILKARRNQAATPVLTSANEARATKSNRPSLAEKIRQARAERPHTFLVTPKLIKRRADDGPISGQAVTDRMVQICGCSGRYDCDCVSVENQARIALWTEHNTQNKEAA